MTHAAVLRPTLLALLIAGASSSVSAYQLYATDDTHLNADLSATSGCSTARNATT